MGLGVEKASIQRDWQPSHVPGESAHTHPSSHHPSPSSTPFTPICSNDSQGLWRMFRGSGGWPGSSRKKPHSWRTKWTELSGSHRHATETRRLLRQLETPCTAADGPLTHASPRTHTTAVCPRLVHGPRVFRGTAAPRPTRG